MTRQLAVGLIVTSPVINPTSEKVSRNSRYFWFDKALIGEVYTTLLPSFRHVAMANSATTVFPAEVCAETSTLSLRSIQLVATCWKGSSSNLYILAGGSFRTC
jgi:hypothetical protein